VEHLKLQVRMNTKNRAVELRTSKLTISPGALQQGEDFVKAFSLGFDVSIKILKLFRFILGCTRPVHPQLFSTILMRDPEY